MSKSDEIRQLLTPLRIILAAIDSTIVVYMLLAFVLSAGYIQGLHLPLIILTPDLLYQVTVGGFAFGAGLTLAAVQWERFNLAPEQLPREKGAEVVRNLLSRIYIPQAMFLESVALIGLILLLAGVSLQLFLLFAGVPLLLLSLKIAHLEDLIPTLERLLP